MIRGTTIAVQLLRELRGLDGPTRDEVERDVRDTLEGSAPVGLAIVTRSRGRASVPPGVLRATLDTHSSALADRKVRARVRLRAAYIGALACGVILGTPIGLLLEALRQGWRP